MEIPLGTALALGTAIFTAGGAWFVVTASTQRLEAALKEHVSLQGEQSKQLEARVNDRLREYAEKKDDQARRIGRAEERLSRLEGFLGGPTGAGVDVVETRRRAITRGGVPLPPGEGEGV